MGNEPDSGSSATIKIKKVENKKTKVREWGGYEILGMRGEKFAVNSLSVWGLIDSVRIYMEMEAKEEKTMEIEAKVE